jgi:desulfoferrodoxin (superoxide reductase-like protein)
MQFGLYKESVRTTLSNTVIKTNQAMTYTAKVTVSFEIHTKHSMQSEHHVEFLNVKLGGTQRNPFVLKG